MTDHAKLTKDTGSRYTLRIRATYSKDDETRAQTVCCMIAWKLNTLSKKLLGWK